MAEHEGNHVVERIYFHSCEYSWNHHRHNISRDVARGAAAGGVAGMELMAGQYQGGVGGVYSWEPQVRTSTKLLILRYKFNTHTQGMP